MGRPSKPIPLSENEESSLFVQWAKLNHEIKNEIFHIANERSTSWQTGKLLKKLGVRPGISDFFIPVMRHGYGGIWLEMKKTRRYTIQESQREWLKLMRKNGFAGEFVFGHEDAIKITTQYLRGEYLARSLEIG